MTKKELAQMLSGREYRHELAHAEAEQAKKDGLVIVFGASDDLMEIWGAIDDDIDCCNGGTAYFAQDDLFRSECDDDDCPYAIIEREKCKQIEAVWCAPGSAFVWTYKTDIPHETFDIMEEEEPYCRGIVFDIADLRE